MTTAKAVDAVVQSMRLALSASVGVVLCKLGAHERTVGCDLCTPDSSPPGLCGPCKRGCGEERIQP